ncbi:Zinc finger, C2H2 domain-containing protein [Strongyloides ratti]|uniref:Zinc finger, C2H2 domain-containing protein n=1 Tax=Strongyloides ratti TaxID=34506 RepID=A0A090LGH2_STRRB|nr:Zinc finger, C2H2 domain-containing protein [Strongyloides ratti]CEF67198.1 Zinc finger, C2H2 domain-containing protein [Strongyloides ratti]
MAETKEKNNINNKEDTNNIEKVIDNVIVGPVEKRCFVRRNDSKDMVYSYSEKNIENPSSSYDNFIDNNKKDTKSLNNIKNDALNCEYIQLLVRNSKAGSNMKNRSNKINIAKDTTCKMIAKRLRSTKLCDIKNIVCLIEDCGRMFQDISVLAFHLTYSHQNHYMPKELRTTCLICGHKFLSIQGKRVHACNFHKKILKQHNEECIKQTPRIYQCATTNFSHSNNEEKYLNWDDDSDEDILEEIIYEEEL